MTTLTRMASRNNHVVMLYADTEFTDFIQTDLISIALVGTKDTPEFYGEITDYRKEDESEFVKAQVLPLMANTPAVLSAGTSYVKSTRQATALALLNYLESVIQQNPDAYYVHVCVDYSTDYALLLDLLYDLKDTDATDRVSTVLGVLRGMLIAEDLANVQSKLPQAVSTIAENNFIVNNVNMQHHALIDARVNRDVHALSSTL